MTPEGGESWRNELEAIRAAMERLEGEQRIAMESLRGRLSEMEKRAGSVPESVVEAVPVVMVKHEEPKPTPEPVILPPPLPKAMPVPPPKEDDGGFEMRLGRVWLVRFGIVLLLTGLVLLGNFAYKNWIRDMPNGVRLLGLFLCAGGLIETGRRLAAKSSLRRPGEVILAGGLAFFYYCTFAAHHVGRLKVIDSPVLAAVLLLGAAGLVAGVSWIRNARATAVLGLLLASYSTALQPIGWLSCVSNVVLASMGLLLMLRPGWTGPGVASMAGTYAAFFGWQLMGAADVEMKDPAVMWFLPPVWAIFAVPGVADRFRESMGDRARAWFTGGNNAAFFLLFSLLWGIRNGWEDYWMVCAVFGAVLLALGIAGRKWNQTAGGVNVFQGLALASLAMIVKLEGFHLALGLAFESLALALAFAKFRTRSELVFSWLAALGAMLFTIVWRVPDLWRPTEGTMPIWSAGITALLIAFSSVVLRAAMERCENPPREAARLASSAMFFFAVATAIAGWAVWLSAPWPVPVMTGIAAVLSAVVIFDRRVRMPEIAFGGLTFLAVAVWRGVLLENAGALAAAGAFTLAAAWLWHRRESSQEKDFQERCVPELHGWAYSVTTAGILYRVVLHGADGDALKFILWLAALALVLMAFAIFTKAYRLAPCAAALNLPGLLWLAAGSGGSVMRPALVTGFALAALGLIFFCGKNLPEKHRVASGWIVRVVAFFGTCFFWHEFAPEFGGDGLAITAIVLLALAVVRKIPAMLEVWGFLILSVSWLLSESSVRWSMNPATATWRGWAVVLALIGLVVWTASTKRGGNRKPIMAAAWTASLMGAVWATQMLVWRHDWDAVSVLWTLLGFALVSGGLWLRLVALRQAGFVLLGLAVIKVFAVDVWDFNAFMRVVAFIVLGAAMILLGLFYNRFAPVLKRLLEEEKEGRDESV